MIITVDGRPLNGPSTKISNTLKEETKEKEEEPLMKGGAFGGLAGAVLGFQQSTPPGLQSRQQQRDAHQAKVDQRPRTQVLSETVNPLSAEYKEKIENAITSGDLNQHLLTLRKISSQEAEDSINEAIKKSERHTKLMNKIHKYLLSMLMYYLFYLTGPYIRESIGLFFYWVIWIFLNLFSLLMLFIIFNICLIIIMVIQKSLNISHAVVGGIAKGMQTAIDKAGFRIFGKNIKLLGFLQGPTNKIKASDDKIPRTARQVIEAIIFSFFAPYLK
uniref:Uncharacterized protein n=1 Tax=viral metagenome TaxID=1070528 RepID=A0A6C0D2N0_9ZZZZ